MRIGELSERTGVSTRLLRYYEEQGLLAPGRSANAYRTYTEDDVAQVQRVAGLIRAGVPTRLITVLLDLEAAEASAALAASCPRQVAEMLADELHELDAKIACLTKSRTTISTFLERTEHTVLLRDAAVADA